MFLWEALSLGIPVDVTLTHTVTQTLLQTMHSLMITAHWPSLADQCRLSHKKIFSEMLQGTKSQRWWHCLKSPLASIFSYIQGRTSASLTRWIPTDSQHILVQEDPSRGPISTRSPGGTMFHRRFEYCGWRVQKCSVCWLNFSDLTFVRAHL